MSNGAAVARPVGRRRWPAGAGPGFGVAVIWAFLALFLVYPLLRIFYDAFSDEAGRLTLRNFVEFASDAYYLRSLWNSMLLRLATVATTSILRYAIAFLLVRYDLIRR